MPVSFTHIINTVSQQENPELFHVQNHTVSSMKTAAEYALGKTGIEFMQISSTAIPESFLPNAVCIKTPHCISGIKGFENERKLPLLLKALKECAKISDTDYLIYTNTDIILTPQFYSFANEIAQQGHDAIVVNRRRVSSDYLKHYNYDLLISEAGMLHPGYDAFIIKRALFEKFIPTDICAGVNGAGNDLFINAFVFANKPVLFTRQHVTIHIGYELVKKWGNKEVTKHNLHELKKLNRQLSPLIDILKIPGNNEPFLKRHFKWLMNPTLSYLHLLKADMRQLHAKRQPYANPEKGSGNRYLEWLLKKITF